MHLALCMCKFFEMVRLLTDGIGCSNSNANKLKLNILEIIFGFCNFLIISVLDVRFT